jgi:hypothetical protein
LAMAYGLPPFHHVFRVKKQRNAINLSGPAKYLAAIAAAQRANPGIILVPGSESVPYYYWRGTYFNDTLTAHDHEKRLLAINLDDPSDYADMPVLHNQASTRYIRSKLPLLMLFVGASLLGVYLITWGRWYRWAGIGVVLLSVLLAANATPFQSSPFDQYMGDIGIAPYQHYIDYVNARGGMTFWNYPETRSGVRQLGPIRVNTPPYPDALLEAKNYTGFAAIYGDTITLTEPGREWDKVLNQYCRGLRKQPAWGISTADFHSEGESGEHLGNFPTVFLVTERNKSAILAAMRSGRMYAVRSRVPQRLVLDDFAVYGMDDQPRGMLGESLSVTGVPHIHVAMSVKEPKPAEVTVRIIRGGTLIHTFTAALPVNRSIVDPGCPRGEKTFYRLMAEGRSVGKLVTNPIFVTRR